MSIAVDCPACGAQFRVKVEFAGRRGKCPKCGAAIDVPALAPAAPVADPAVNPAPARHAGVAPVSAAIAGIAHPARSKPAAGAAPRGRPLPPRPATPAAAQQEILSKLAVSIDPVPTSLAYKAAVVLVACVMLLLPLAYLGIIAGVGYLLYLHAVHDTWIVSGTSARGRGSLIAFAIYLGPLVAGGILLLFMCKPLFARSGRRDKPRSLSPTGEPLLFAFVERLTAAVGAPCPARIDVDCQVNASAGFRRGILSMIGRDMVLTLGLPLVAGLNLRQFAGVLAHEFGHFAQGWGMRLSYLVRSINFWFQRVVYERDEWDQRLVDWSAAWDWRLGIFLYLARLCVWLTRQVLWVLMMAGHAVSGILLREMEFDADLYETRLAGSDAFESTCRRLNVLNVATSGAMADLRHWYRESKLGDDLPRLILANVDQLSPEARRLINQHVDQSQTGWFDTHPADRDRIARAKREAAPGQFRDERPAVTLFTDFAALSRTATFDCYKALLGSALKITDLHPTDRLVARQDLENAAVRAMGRYFQDTFHVIRPLPFVTGWLEPPKDAAATEAQLRHARERMTSGVDWYQMAYQEFAALDGQLVECEHARALLDAGFKVKANAFSQPLSNKAAVKQSQALALKRQAEVATALDDFEQVAARRVTTALELLFVADVAARIPESQALTERCRQLLTAVVAINRTIPSLLQLRGAHGAITALLQNLEGNEQNQDLLSTIHDQMKTLHRLIDEILNRLGRADYPFAHGRGKMSIANYCAEMTPSSEDLAGQLNAGAEILDRLPTLLVRLMAQLAVAAERIENTLGLPPLPEPKPETD